MATGFFMEAEGHVVEMDLPLPEPLADRLTKGYLKRVNADGSPWTGEVVDPLDGETDEVEQHGETDEPVVDLEVARPNVNASKAEWVGYAVKGLGMDPDDAEAATKQDLIDLANQK